MLTEMVKIYTNKKGFLWIYIHSPDELIFGPDDGLEEAQILDMLSVGFDVLDIVLNHLLAHLQD